MKSGQKKTLNGPNHQNIIKQLKDCKISELPQNDPQILKNVRREEKDTNLTNVEKKATITKTPFSVRNSYYTREVFQSQEEI